MKPFYITTAIDYANGPPHIGHALEKIGADVTARYHRRRGDPTRFVIGMDEHGLKVLESAESAGITPQAWVDRIAGQFAAAWDRLHVSHDDFIRTTQARHHEAVRAIIGRMQESGDLYRGSYAGYYCVGCEAYKREDDLERLGEGPTEAGAAGAAAFRCPIHPGRPITWMEEENWFFQLSRYRDPLLELLDANPEFVQPEARRNEIRRVLADGLEDISVSRSRLPWGIPWPDDPDQTVYVWIDALTNYLAAVGFPDEAYREWWPADVHVIGKDITRFHCIYWPAMLMSAGLELPRSIWAHGFLGFEGRKLSKSEGAWVELDDAIGRHGPDALRYYLMREIPWNGDGDFSWERFDTRYTADLADDLGNLASRTLSMIERYRDGVVPDGDATSLDDHLREARDGYERAMDRHLLHQGAAAAMQLADAANAFVEERAPWKQARQPQLAAQLDATLASLARALAALCSMLEPFMPHKMTELARRLGLASVPSLQALPAMRLADRKVHRGEILFPKPS